MTPLKTWVEKINGITIYPPAYIKNIKKNIKKILLAIDTNDRSKRFEILNQLKKYEIPLLQIPSTEDITSGKAKIDALVPIDINDLLKRKPVQPIEKFIKNGIQDQIVLITGAGGSIGSELCRQINKLYPKKIILLERSELNLFNLSQELKLNNKIQELIRILSPYLDAVQIINF